MKGERREEDAVEMAAAAPEQPATAPLRPAGKKQRGSGSVSVSRESVGVAPASSVGVYRRGLGRLKSVYTGMLAESGGVAWHGERSGGLRGVLSPDARWLAFWRVGVALAAVAQAVTVPYRAVFGFERPWAWFCFDTACDLVFAADMALSVRTAFWDAGRLQTDPALVRAHYVREGSFWWDAAASVPLSLGQLATGWQPAWRLHKLARLSTASRLLRRSEDNPEVSMASVRVLRLVMYTLLLSHFVGCGWFVFGHAHGFGSDLWVPSEELRESPRVSQYLSALFFALGTMKGISVHETVEGDMPQTTDGALFTIAVILCGVVLFAYIVGSIDNVVDVTRDNYARFHQVMASTSRFMSTHGLSADLQARVQHYYAYVWDRTRGFHKSNPMMSRLDRLPPVLRADMAAALPARILANTPLFLGLEEGFVAALVQSLQQRFCTPGEFVFHAGDLGDDVYFIVGGKIRVLVGPFRTHVATLNAGDSFGSYGALLQQPRTAYTQAQTYCDLLFVSRERLDTVLESFPAAREKVQERVRRSRANTLKKEKKKGVEGGGDSLQVAAGRRSTAPTTTFSSLQAAQPAAPVGDPMAAATAAAGGAGPAGAAAAAARARILPHGRAYWAWQAAVCAVGVFMAWDVPFRAVFVYYDDGAEEGPGRAARLAGNAAVDLFLAATVAARFTTAYAANGHLVHDARQVRRHYLRTRFVANLVATLPLDWIALAAGARNPLWRATRVLWVADAFAVLSYAVNHSSRHTLVRLGRLLLTILLLAHAIACVYFSFTFSEGYGDDAGGWLMPERERGSSVMFKYARSFFFALALLTGSGKVPPPETDMQALFTMAVLLVGIFVVATVISGVANLVSNLDTFATEHHKDHRFVVQYMRFHRLPRPFFDRVQAVYDQHWSQERGVDPNVAFRYLPLSLRSEVLMQIYGSIVRDIPLFECAPDEFIHMLSASVSLQVFPEGEYVYRRGHLGDTMFFVVSGTVSLMMPAFIRLAPAGGAARRRRSLLERLMRGKKEGAGGGGGSRYKVAPAPAEEPDKSNNNNSGGGNGSKKKGITVRWGAEVDEVSYLEMQRGCFFGEGVMLDDGSPRQREASARAETLCNVLVLDRERFKQVFEPSPGVLADFCELARMRLELASVLAAALAEEHTPAEAKRTVQETVQRMFPGDGAAADTPVGDVVRRASVMDGVEKDPCPPGGRQV